MPADLQPKLLRVLQEKVYYRVGSDKPQEADFRLICSTNRDPFESIKDGNLREDLYYRINTIEITIPPLRERMEDVPMLAEHFLQIYADKYKKPNTQFSQNAYNQMLNYTWRGNVRELEHAIERAVLLSRGGKIESMNLLQANGTAVSGEFPSMQFTAAAAASGSGDQPAFNGLSSLPSMVNLEGDELFEEIGRFIVDRLQEPTEGTDQKDVFNDIESGVVLAALKRTRGNKQAAANLLGLYRPRLYGMIKRHSLEDRV
jgi:DNA-binding NtrC family response regulator